MSVTDSAVYVGGKRVAEGLAPDQAVSRALADDGTVWLALADPDADELGRLGDLLKLSPHTVTDASSSHQRALLERHDDAIYLVLQPAAYDDANESVDFTQVVLFAGPHYLVVVGRGKGAIDHIDEMRHGTEQRADLARKGPYTGVWGVLDWVVGRYAPVLAGVENDIDEIEDQLFSRDRNVSQRIFKLQREVIDLEHATGPLVDMLERLQPVVEEALGEGHAELFTALADRAHRIDGRVSGFRHTLDNALTVDATLSDQERNEEMQRMTEFGLEQNDQVKKISAWAAILFAPTLVGTIYGMNFRNMPELEWTYGYPLAVLAMVVFGVILYAVFKKRSWL